MASVADAGDSRFKAYADVEPRLAFRLPFFLQLADASHHVQSGLAGEYRVALLFERSAPKGHHRVTNVFIECAAMLKDDLSHVGEILIEEKGQFLGVELFRDGGEAANVAEHDGDFGFARFDQLWID